MKTEITKAEYYQLVGLLTLAKKHGLILSDIAKSIAEMTQEGDDMGHSYDAVYAPYDAEMLLSKLNIRVAEPAPTKEPRR